VLVCVADMRLIVSGQCAIRGVWSNYASQKGSKRPNNA